VVFIIGFQDLTGSILSVVGDVSVDSEASVMTLSISEVLRAGLCACIRRDGCACMFISVCVCTVFFKKTRCGTSFCSFCMYEAAACCA
jgi:hypothetical protein